MILRSRPRVVVQLVTRSSKHLSHNVFIHITKVGIELVTQQLLIDNVIRKVLLPKGKVTNNPVPQTYIL